VPPAISAYFAVVRRLLADLEERESPAIERAAEGIAGSITAGGVLHVFGSGHSMLAAIESTVRAGGLAAVHLLYDPALSPTDPEQVSQTERLHGHASSILDNGDLRSGETIIVVSNSGINPVPIEIALGARDRGLRVVAITSAAHSTAAASRHESGRRLLDVADVVIDTGAPHGDTTVVVGGFPTGAVSTILASAAIHAITIRVVELMVAAGADVPLLVSQNVDVTDEHNLRLLDRYRRAPRRQ
jgi:uncharacterized phosphosugar-binding protein